MYIGLHNHTDYSNLRLRDALNTVESLINYTHELKHTGVAITEHECVSSSIQAQKYLKELKEKNPEEWKDFKLILGNEIYLCARPENDKKPEIFPHFILLAKDKEGHRQIRELSTRAWVNNSFMYVMMRVPTYCEDLIDVIGSNPGHVIGSSACLGGTLARLILKAYSNNSENPDLASPIKWALQMKQIFGKDNFFLEMQPSYNEQQIIVNKAILKISQKTKIPYIITTDAHYEKKEDREIHKAFLNADEGDRETDNFYATTYIMSEEEIHSYMDESLGTVCVQKGIDNTLLVANQCEDYDLTKPLDIPYVPSDIREPSAELFEKYKEKIPTLEYFYFSTHDSDRHMARTIMEKLEKNPEELQNDKVYEAIEDNLGAVKISSEKAGTQWSGYMLQTQELIKTCWESGSLVGDSRGSGGGFLLLYLLDIIQINPVQEDAPLKPWRFLNPERVSVLDIDVDVEGDKRALIIENLSKKYNGNRHISKVQTLLTEKGKSALITACRGLGLTPEEGAFLASFIGAERGIQYTLKQTYYGDEENNIPPNREFKEIMDSKYPQVWKVAQKIEGLINGVGSHAGGVILCAHDIVDDTALMKTNSGDIITQYNLHDDEAVGLIKWDLLGIDALQKIHICMNLLIQDGYMKAEPSLKETYEKYLNIYKIDRTSDKIWDLINQHKIISLFQFEKQSGRQAIDIGKPRSLVALSALNSVMRLMAVDGSESPLQRYGRLRENINLWYDEMRIYGLNDEEILVVQKYAKRNFGLLPNQEDFMQIVQDPEIGGMSLLWADKLRKSIAKKNPKDYIQLQKEFFENVQQKQLSYKLCAYVWNVLIAMNRGYAFNMAHTLAYSIIGVQEANLALYYPRIYWNASVLISDSGGETGTTNYGKIAKAIGSLQKEGVKIVLPDINRAHYGFRPDVKADEIVYGLRGMQGVGDEAAKAIVASQPYTSLQDFIEKMQIYKQSSSEAKYGDSTTIMLIKGGAFDSLEKKNRIVIMQDFIKSITPVIKSLSWSNLEDLIKLNLITPEQKQYEVRLYKFCKYVCSEKFFDHASGKGASTNFYKLDHKYAEPYFLNYFENNMEENKDYMYNNEGYICVKKGSLDREFKKLTSAFSENILNNPSILAKINDARYQQMWDEKASGTISKWEMDSLCFYYTEHELAHVNPNLYNIVSFDMLPSTPEVEDQYFWRGQQKARFKLSKIWGTVLDRDKNHNSVELLTPDGVVSIKFYKGQFGYYDKQIASVDEETGKKTVLEKSWFSRGNKLIITGFRRDEQFVPRVYKDSIFNHSVQLIKEITEKNELVIQSDRIGEEE